MADGWYEWVKDPDDPKKKQPYFIRLRSQNPIFFTALVEVHPGLEPHEGDGFVIITAASDQGMVDIHDRRPVVFTFPTVLPTGYHSNSSVDWQHSRTNYSASSRPSRWIKPFTAILRSENHGKCEKAWAELILPV